MDGDDLIFTLFGFIIGVTLAMFMYNVLVPKIYESGDYVTYRDKIYREVPEEELDNLVIMEVK